MDFPAFRKSVSTIRAGKQLPDAVYLHISALTALPSPLTELIFGVADALNIPDDAWNVLKLYKRDYKLTFLSYPEFEESSYPSLDTSYTVDLNKLTVRRSQYGDSSNPPILHRKEAFVTQEYPLRSLFEEITQEGEAIGLYENSRSIGFKNSWERLISNKGYYLDDYGRLKPKAGKSETEVIDPPVVNGQIDRHKTAIERNKLSQPLQILARHGYLDGQHSILDYGCGKGDDLRELEAHGIDVEGWDPTHRPEGKLQASDIVNLGFVINVIEDRGERVETLLKAWKFANKMLIASVMIAGESVVSQFTPFKDGVLTKRNTFQKYYSQSEFRSFLESNLDDNAIAVGQGFFIVFRDKTLEQQFLVDRQHVNRNWQQKTQRQIQARETLLNKDAIDKHIDLFTDFWDTCLDLGRIPANNEFEFSELIRRIAGSHNKAHQSLVKVFGDILFLEAQQARKDDLIVYFALSLFGKRKPQTHLPDSIKRDIKVFFDSYSDAIEQATIALYSVGKPDLIEIACTNAYQKIRSGVLEEGHSYTFHKKYLGDLPPELRIYIGCATQLYGDLEYIHLIKVHMGSGKVSIMRYDDWTKDIPLLIERIKIKMREQDVEFFDYGGKFKSPPLPNKYLFEKH